MFFVNGESVLLVAFGKYTLSKLYSHCTQLLYLYFHRNMVSDISVLSGDDSINACDCRCCISSFNSQTSRMSIFTSCAHNCWIFISVDWWNDNKLVNQDCIVQQKTMYVYDLENIDLPILAQRSIPVPAENVRKPLVF